MAISKNVINTVKAPATPKAPQAAKAPQAKAAPQEAKKGPPGKPQAPQAPKLAAPQAKAAPQEATGPNSNEKALLAKITALQEQIAKIATRAPKGPKAYTPEELIEGLAVAKGDWRADYQGVVLPLKAFGFGNKGEIELEASGLFHCLLTIPRDFHKQGGHARSTGLIACHFEQNEAGLWAGEPCYLNAEQLASVWAD